MSTNGLKWDSLVAGATRLLHLSIITTTLSLAGIVVMLGASYPIGVKLPDKAPDRELLKKRVTERAESLGCQPAVGITINPKQELVIFACEPKSVLILFRATPVGDWEGYQAVFPEYEEETEI